VNGPRLLLFTVLSCIAFWLLGAGVVQVLVVTFGLDLGGSYGTVAERQQLRLILLLNNLFTFGLPALLALLLTDRSSSWRVVGLAGPTRPELRRPAALTFLVGLPLIGLLVYLNLLVDLPDWMERSEASSNALLEGVLTFEGPLELPLALLAIAVTAGLSEELMFRGLLQRGLLRPLVGPVAAIWIAAFLFSAVHLEFAGFLPRLLLGALLGYALRWTGSLWVPILLHALYNGVQVVITYGAGEFTPDTEVSTDLAVLLPLGVLSGTALVYLVRRYEARYRMLTADGSLR
jgi:membrane protease YdiL (CAAX protease family)